MEVGTVQRIDIEQKMRSAYLSYAMSVITARALPDVRDGLKPVQRRILYAMHDMGLRHDTPTRKSARIVGEVLGKYHPHGDSAVYDAMVRMAQDFTMRYPLVDGQGNFGSVDGDEAAALRYTEARLTALGEELLLDLDKNTVAFSPNFDGTLQEPTVLPAKLPNLLVNGVGGIAVGMATNIPPHNLGEVADAIAYLIDHYDQADDVSLDDLMQFIHGPDFPTGGMILGSEGIRQAYATGRGRVVVRALAHTEDLKGGQTAIIITELPYQVNKAALVERIAALTREEKLIGIGDLRDESDRTGMRVVIELKRGVEAGPLLNDLLKYTQLQTTFGVNMLALVDGEPRTLSLKRVLLHHIEHRHEVITRRTQFELEKARARAHVLEGLLVALDNLDEVIATIRASRTAETARDNLRTRFKLTEIQAQAILDMQLRRLAALERNKIKEEYKEVQERIKYLLGLLASKHKILGLIKEDVLDLKQRFADARRTHISDLDETAAFQAADLVPDEEVVVALTRQGNARRTSARAYRDKRDESASADREALQAVFVAGSRETTLWFTDRGRVYALPAHQLPDAAQQPKGLPLSNLLHLEPGEVVASALHLPESATEGFITLATREGKVKRLELAEVIGAGRGGAAIIGLSEGDALIWAAATTGADEIVLVSAQGQAIRFAEDSVRPQGRAGGGVRGVTLKEGDALAAADVARPGGELLIVTTLGYAKRSAIEEYGAQGRGGQGAQTMDVTKLATSGPIVAARVVRPDDEVVFVTKDDAMLRVKVADVPRLERASWGRLVTRTHKGALVQGGEVVGLVRLEGPKVERTTTPTQKEPPAGAPQSGSPTSSQPATKAAEPAPEKKAAPKSQAKEEVAAKPPTKPAPTEAPQTGAPTSSRPAAKAQSAPEQPAPAQKAAKPASSQPEAGAPQAAPAEAKPARARKVAALATQPELLPQEPPAPKSQSVAKPKGKATAQEPPPVAPEPKIDQPAAAPAKKRGLGIIKKTPTRK